MNAELIRELFDYDPATGIFLWRANKPKRLAKAGDAAGTLTERGYIRIRFAGRVYSAHRLAWLYVYGEWPPALIDHINHACDDNRIKNLRLASDYQNQGNRKISRNNTSGYKGVHFHKHSGKWHATMCINGKQVHVGSSTIKEEAADAYRIASLKHHGEFSIFHNITA